MHFLSALSGAGTVSALSACALVAIAATVIRVLWRRGTTPWDA